MGPLVQVGDIWSPRTDLAVAVQVVVTVAATLAGAWLARRERALVLLILGVGTVVLAWYGVRALH